MATPVIQTSELMHAVRAGNLDGVLLAIAHGADVEEADMHGYRGLPLRTACFSGHYDIVLALLEHGANVNAPTAEGNGAPLRLARRAKHQHIASLLLERGAELPYEEVPVPKPLIEPMPTPVAEVTEKPAEPPTVIEAPQRLLRRAEFPEICAVSRARKATSSNLPPMPFQQQLTRRRKARPTATASSFPIRHSDQCPSKRTPLTLLLQTMLLSQRRR